jgi:hypothetical protein
VGTLCHHPGAGSWQVSCGSRCCQTRTSLLGVMVVHTSVIQMRGSGLTVGPRGGRWAASKVSHNWTRPTRAASCSASRASTVKSCASSTMTWRTGPWMKWTRARSRCRSPARRGSRRPTAPMASRRSCERFGRLVFASEGAGCTQEVSACCDARVRSWSTAWTSWPLCASAAMTPGAGPAGMPAPRSSHAGAGRSALGGRAFIAGLRRSRCGSRRPGEARGPCRCGRR